MLTVVVDVGELNAGVAVDDDATGDGFIMFSTTDVHDRFSGIPNANADHFLATRLDGLQWQYNNNSDWINFEPADGDAIVAVVNFDGDSVQNGDFRQQSIEGIWFRSELSSENSQPIDFRVVANQWDGQPNDGEFAILGSTIEIEENAPGRSYNDSARVEEILNAMFSYQAANQSLPGLANFDADGNPLLSWRVHMLPYLGLDSLYAQFNLDEPWNSPNNLPLTQQMPEVFSSPHFNSATRTPYLAPVGDKTIFKPDGTPAQLPDASEGDAVMVVQASGSQSAIWTAPFDWQFDESDPDAGLGQRIEYDYDYGAVYYSLSFGLSDGTVRSVFDYLYNNGLNDVDEEAFRVLVDVTDNSSIADAIHIAETDEFQKFSDVSTALRNYESAYGAFPQQAINGAGDVPLLSWRVAILPFIGHQDLYDQFNLDEPWDSEHNLSLLDQIPVAYNSRTSPNGTTTIVGIDGEGAIFDSNRDRGVRFNEISDGGSNTILVLRTTTPVPWTKPQDLEFDASDPGTGLHSSFTASLANGVTTDFDLSQPERILPWTTFAGDEINDYGIADGNTDGFRFIEDKLGGIAHAVANYASSLQQYPHTIYDMPEGQGGSPLLSWRVRILPYIDQYPLYQQFRFDEPWDSAHNLSLLPLMPSIFQTEGVDEGMTVFQGAHGPNTLFPDSNNAVHERAFQDNENVAGVMQVSPDNAIEWTRPDDFTYDPATIRSIVENADATGFHISLSRGDVHFFNDTINTDVLNKIVSPQDFEDVNVDLKVFRDLTPGDYWSSFNSTSNDLRVAAIGAQNFESTFARLPHHAIYERPDGDVPLLSWRVEILPFIGYQELYDKFNHNEPWDSTHNLSLLPLMPHYFSHPSIENGMTIYQALSDPWSLGETPETLFPISNEFDFNFANITDGASNTVMFVETNADQAVEWTRPDDLVFQPGNPTEGLYAGENGQGMWVVMADASSRFIPSSFLASQFAAAVSPQNGDAPDFNNTDNFQYGDVFANNIFGTENDDVFEINIDGDSLELTINGVSQSFSSGDFDWLTLDGLAGQDSVSISGVESIELTEAANSFSVGDFFFVLENFEQLDFGNVDEFHLNGTDADDFFSVVFDQNNETVSLQINQQTSFSIPYSLNQKIIVDGGLGNDEVTVSVIDDSIVIAELTPTSATIVDVGMVEWTNVESQVARDIDNVTIADSPGDDHVELLLSDLHFSGPGFDWTVFDADSVGIVATSGNDTVFVLGNPFNMDAMFHQTTISLPETTYVFDGFGETTLKQTRRNEAIFRLDGVDQLDVEVFDDGARLTSPTSNAVLNLEIERIKLSGYSEDRVSFTKKTEDDIVAIDLRSFRRRAFFDADSTKGFSSVEFGLGMFLNDITVTTTSENDVVIGYLRDTFTTAVIDGDNMSMTGSEGSSIQAIGFKRLRAEARDFLVRGNEYDSMTFNGGSQYDLVGETNSLIMRVSLNQSPTIDFRELSSVPALLGSETAGEVVRIDFSNESAEMTVRGLPDYPVSNFLLGVDRSIRVDPRVQGGDITDSLTVIPPRSVDVSISNEAVTTPFGHVDIVNVERLLIDGHLQATPVAIVDLPNGTQDIFVKDRSLEIPSLWTVLSIEGFQKYELDADQQQNFINFVDERTNLKRVVASHESIDFVSKADIKLNPNTASYDVTSTIPDQRLTLVDTEGDEQVVLGGENNHIRMSGATGTINATGYSTVQMTSSGGNDTGTITDLYEEALLLNDGYRFDLSNGSSASVIGLSLLRISDKSNLPSIRGTSGADVFSLGFFATSTLLEVDGNMTQLQTPAGANYNILGSTGDDRLDIDGRRTEDSQLSYGEWTASNAAVSWGSVENVEIRGAAAIAINFNGIDEDETFRFVDGTASLTNEAGSRISSTGFGTNTVDGAGGNDRAFLSGAPSRANTFVGNESFGTLTTPSQTVTANGFDLVSVVGSGNDDVATFVGTQADEQFYAYPTQGRFESSSFVLNASGFARITAEGGGGNDYANLTDSDGNDTLVAREGFARLSVGPESVTAVDFTTVRSVSSNGSDVAEFEGSLGAERFIASDRFGRLNGDGYSLIAVSYPEVVADGNGGADEAYLSDSAGDDSFVGTPDQSYLAGNGFKNTAINFGEVIAFSSQGFDSAEFNGSIGNDTFYGNPNLANLLGERFFQFASGFELVRAFGGGGDDSATLRDSNVVDQFFANDKMASLSNDNFRNEVHDFSRVKAVSLVGVDFATFEGSGRSDFFHGHRDSSYMEGDGYRNQANGFRQVSAVGLAGTDTANLHDSNEDEEFVARGDTASLQGFSYRIEVEEFETVSVFGFQGGNNELTIDNPEFEWNRFGTWN